MNILIENLAFAITCDAADRVIAGASLVVENDRIAAVGPSEEIERRFRRDSFDTIRDGRRYGVTPGFIDAHVHLSEMLSRGIYPDDVNTREWVFNWAMPFYAHLGEEDERVGALLSIAEMLRCGTTCFLDMGAQSDVAVHARAIETSGIRGITGRHAADQLPKTVPPGWPEGVLRRHFFPSAEAALEVLATAVKQWNGKADGRIGCWMNIQGKEPCSLALHVGARRVAQELGVGSTYHLASSREETDGSIKNFGVGPIARIDAHGGLGSNLVLAHASAVSKQEIEMLAKAGTKVAFCPGTSLKLAKGATSIGTYPEMMAHGVTVALGTDGPSASGNLSLMRQMYLVAGLFKDARLDAAQIGARQALRMATIDGARALMLDDKIGSLAAGKKADFVLFDLDHVEWTPYVDPVQSLVWSASPASIAETWVDGRRVFFDGCVATLDERAIRQEARERALALRGRARLGPETTKATAQAYA
jgi:5-methylthioadenosine/S-adenosylhomocysteine deaminase